MINKVELIYKCNNNLGEGITFYNEEQSLYWLDISNKSKLYKFNLITNNKEMFELPEIVTATSVKSKNELILVSNNGINLFNIYNNKFERIINIENSFLSSRSNDGASDALGRLWFGTMQNNFDKKGNDIPINKNIGKLYKVEPNKKITIVEENLGIPNTFIWSPDNSKFYFTDTLTETIFKYDFDLESGEIKNKQEFDNFN